MPLPWLQDVDPAERLPDDTKWETLDELTLWKQCKLRGLDGRVRKEGDSLRILNRLKTFKVKWRCYPEYDELPEELIDDKALESLTLAARQRALQVLHVEEREAGIDMKSAMVIKLSDATVTIEKGGYKNCSCGMMVSRRFTGQIQIWKDISDGNA